MNADYEFSDLELFDYIKGETQEQMNRASFDSYAASGFVPTVNTTRTAQNESLCDFSEAENSQMVILRLEPEKSKSTMNINLEPESQRDTGLTNKDETPNSAEENPTIKKRKLGGVKTRQNRQWKLHLTTPKTPLLQTSLRARPPKIKSSEELEIEDLKKAPKFQARPLNKKILESKGELGLFCNIKRQVTIPQEFHFAIDERIPPRRTANAADLFDKTVLCIEPCKKKLIPRSTAPRPFHLQTEERGAWKESISVTEVLNKEIEEEQARIPKVNPCRCTTDCPVVPRKPEPRHCTKPEPFRLESLVRHEENIQREMEERRRMEEEEASMRVFKAQPILKEDPIPVPEKVRKALTEVQQFNLHVEQRAMVRAEFDKKMKEKEMICKRCQDEAEAAKMMEEENVLKQLRRTMVPHARPMPDFNQPFLPQKSSKGVTKPKSPRLKVLERMVGRRRRMIVAAATSTAASNMR